jgi:hypothetical protein
MYQGTASGNEFCQWWIASDAVLLVRAILGRINYRIGPIHVTYNMVIGLYVATGHTITVPQCLPIGLASYKAFLMHLFAMAEAA